MSKQIGLKSVQWNMYWYQDRPVWWMWWFKHKNGFIPCMEPIEYRSSMN